MRLTAHSSLSAWKFRLPLIAGMLSVLLEPCCMAADGVRAWDLSLAADAGFNANVIHWNDELTLPVGVSDEEALYQSVSLSACYRFLKSGPDELSASYDYSQTFFDGLSEYDQAVHVLGADYSHHFVSAGVIAAVKTASETEQIGGSSFRQRFVVRPAVARRMSEWLVAEGSWTFMMDEFQQETGVPEQNRDGNAHIGALAAYIYPPATDLEIQIGSLYTTMETKGSDFDATGTGWVLGLKHPLPWNISSWVQYTRTSRESDEINSIRGDGASPVSLDMDTDAIDVGIQKALGVHWKTTAGYGMSKSEANVSYYSYEQTVWKAGVSYSF